MTAFARLLRIDGAAKVSKDGRLRFIALLLFPALIGHAIQLTGEDSPGTAMAMARYWITPGWHLALPPALVVAFAVGLGVASVGLLLRRSRFWLASLILFYIAHYFTYPFRIRNHMSMMLASLLAIGGAWLVGRVSRRDALDRERLVDAYAIRGLATVLVITYLSASLHKMNAGFLGPHSSAVEGVDVFFVYGDLGHAAPAWVRAVAVYGTIVVEAAFPLLALFVPVYGGLFVIGLMLFHFPHVAVMNVADYPMIASTFYPALFSLQRWTALERFLHTPSKATVGGALIGAGAQLWFLPWWGGLTVFGIFVAALWGWWSAAIVQLLVAERRAKTNAL